MNNIIKVRTILLNFVIEPWLLKINYCYEIKMQRIFCPVLVILYKLLNV